MAITGDAFTVYLQNAYLPTAIQTVFWNTYFFSPKSPFTVVPPAQCPGGPNINQIYDYSVTTNAEVYVRGAPGPDPDTLNSVRAYFTKDTFQASAKVYRDAMAQAAGQNGTVLEIAMQQKAIDASLKNLMDKISATFLTDLAAQVDSSTALGDGSLSRTTYSLASYEADAGGALALADIEDAIEGLQNVTYGVPDVPTPEMLVMLMARNQGTNLSRLTGGASNYVINIDAQSMASADAGRILRQKSYEGVDISYVPDMTNTEIYIVRKDAAKIFLHDPFKADPKDVFEYANAWLATAGANLVITNVRCAAKITGITA